MALILEDGTGKTDAQSYASEAELAAYAAARGVTIAGTDTQLLITAMDYIETKDFIGYKASSDQALQWPRLDVVVDGYYIDSDEIPLLLKEAQIEVALSIDGGTNPMSNEERATKIEKVDVIEVEYSDHALDKAYITAAETKLTKLVKSNARVYRA